MDFMYAGGFIFLKIFALNNGSPLQWALPEGSSMCEAIVIVARAVVGFGSGFAVMFGRLTGRMMRGSTALFLATRVARSVTRFGLS